MSISNDSLNKKLYQLLRVQGFDPIPMDETGEVIPVPDEAEVFKFTYKQNGEAAGNAWITVDGNKTLKIYYDDKLMNAGAENDQDSAYDSFTDFLKQLKMWAQRKQLGFDTENKDHLQSDMAQREYMKKKEQIAEGYYPMGKSASYNDAIPTVKIVLQHTRQIQEGEQRYRNIAKIFLENQQGERILAPTTKPGIAQVYARHLAEGGLPHDERWNHIGSLVEEYSKMAGFVRATRGGQFNESAQQLVNEGVAHYHSLRESLGKMRGHRGYQAYFESWTPALMENEGEESNLNELFVQETLDPRIESVMPILSRIHKQVNEMSEVSALEEWADQLISEKMVMGVDSDASSAGSFKMGEATDEYSIPEDDLDEGIADDYEDMADRELMRHARMLGLEKNIVPDDEGGLANRREIIHLLQKEASDEVDEGIGDVAKKVGGALKKAGQKALDTLGHGSDEELIKDLQKKAGVPPGLRHGKPSMAKPNESVEEDLDANQKRAGQLGPTGGPAKVGDLVGANESVEFDELEELKRLIK